MNLWTDFTTARQRRLQDEFEASTVRIVYSLADKITDLTYAERCKIRDSAVEARMMLSIPIWSSERREIAAESLRILLIFTLWIGQLWIFNVASLERERENLLGQPYQGALGATITEQSLFLLVGLCSIHLAVRPRWVLLCYRRALTRSPSQTPTIHIIFTAHLAAVLIGLPWMLTTITRSYHSWLIGWLIFFTMDLFMVLIGGRADRILYSVMFGIRRPQEQRYRHKLVWYLFLLTSYLYASLDSWEDDIQVNRRALKIVAKEIEQDRLSLRAVGRFEFTLRRDIRSEQLRLATAIRNHARSLAMAHSETDYRLICDSIRAGLLAAVECDWSSLVANTALDNVGTRLSRHLRRFTPSLVLILFAVGIPFLPGVDQNIGASLRLLLLSTALLALVPVGDSTSTTIKEALGKALTPTSKER